MRTLPCKECGNLYTDNIDPKVNESKGGYIICAYCAMSSKPSAPVVEQISSKEFAEEIGAEYIGEPEEKGGVKWKKKGGK